MRETELKINEVFLQKPELRQYFYGGVDLEENSLVYADAESAAELILDVMEHVLWQARFFPQLFTPEKSEEGTQDTWKNYFHDMFILSPLLRKYLEKRQRWYSPLVIDIMKQANAMTSHGYKPDSYPHFTIGDEKENELLQGTSRSKRESVR
jgi:hypothetical protein